MRAIPFAVATIAFILATKTVYFNAIYPAFFRGVLSGNWNPVMPPPAVSSFTIGFDVLFLDFPGIGIAFAPADVYSTASECRWVPCIAIGTALFLISVAAWLVMGVVLGSFPGRFVADRPGLHARVRVALFGVAWWWLAVTGLMIMSLWGSYELDVAYSSRASLLQRFLGVTSHGGVESVIGMTATILVGFALLAPWLSFPPAHGRRRKWVRCAAWCGIYMLFVTVASYTGVFSFVRSLIIGGRG